jgi:hypothetical protein
MAHRTSRCQRDYRAKWMIRILIACAVGTAVSGQERSKPEAEAVALARRTLIAKLLVGPERITTVSVSPAQWRDSSLGCPQRGMTYTPVISSGYEVTLRDADREHVVHVAGGRAVICGSQSDPKQPPAAMVSASLKAANAVRAALSARLGIEPARIRILSTRPLRSTPCPAAPASPNGAALIVEAEAAAQTFRYYADDAEVRNCNK